MTPERLAEIRELAQRPVRTHMDTAVLVRHRDLLLAEVDRLTAEHALLTGQLRVSRSHAADRLADERDTAVDEVRVQSARAARAEAERDEAVRRLNETRAALGTAREDRDRLLASLNAAWEALSYLSVDVIGGQERLAPVFAALVRPPATEGLTHRCPPAGSGVMPCCGRSPLEVPRTDRLTAEPELVTCRATEDTEGSDRRG